MDLRHDDWRRAAPEVALHDGSYWRQPDDDRHQNYEPYDDSVPNRRAAVTVRCPTSDCSAPSEDERLDRQAVDADQQQQHLRLPKFDAARPSIIDDDARDFHGFDAAFEWREMSDYCPLTYWCLVSSRAMPFS